MANASPQNFSQHTRWDPLFHFFILPVFAISLVGSIVLLVMRPGMHTAWFLIFMIAELILIFKVRLYPLKVQDRVIRLEERLRLATLLPEPLRARIPELTEAQLVGLRFASDAEIPKLVERTLKENLSRKDIKKAIQNWRPDYWRV